VRLFPARNALWIKRQRRHFVQLVLLRYLRNARAHSLELRFSAAVAAVGLTKKRLIAERPQSAFDWPDDREISAPETLSFPQGRSRFPFPAVAINLHFRQVK
jgi:hypothetical protein